MSSDGEISFEDTNILICYYFINNRVSYDDVHPKTYDPAFSGSINLPVGYDDDTTSFARMVNNIAHKLLIDHYIIEDMADKGIIDLDVNEDGTVDIADLAYLKINGDNYLDNFRTASPSRSPSTHSPSMILPFSQVYTPLPWYLPLFQVPLKRGLPFS